MFNEAQTGFAVNRAVKLLAARNSQPVYYYKFSYKGKYSHYYLPGTNNTVTYGGCSNNYYINKISNPFEILGPVHHDDLIYLFNISTLFPTIQKGDVDFRTVQKLTYMWSNFARTGYVLNLMF